MCFGPREKEKPAEPTERVALNTNQHYQHDNEVLRKQNNDQQAQIAELRDNLQHLQRANSALQQTVEKFQERNVPYPRVDHPPAVTSSPSSSPPRLSIPPVNLPPPIRVPVYFAKNTSDLPDIIELFNNDDSNRDPKLEFHLLHPSEEFVGRHELAIILAICATDRVDVTDRDLVEELKNTKGYRDVLLVVLRRGNDPSKFKANHDQLMNSGVGDQKAILQFVYYKGHLMMDAEANASNMVLFFRLVKTAF